MGLFSGPWLTKEEHERSVHLNLISRINSLELNSYELGARLQVAQGRIAELEQEIDDYETTYKGSVVEAQAKRIAELEGEFDYQKNVSIAALKVADDRYARITELESENERLKAAFRVNMLRAFSNMTHEEIDAEIAAAIRESGDE